MNSSERNRTRTGLENCVQCPPAELQDARIGLLMNQASVNRQFRYSCDVIAARWPGQLMQLFSPQHGLWGEQQANMIESPDSRYAPLNLPVHSLYAKTRRPSRDSLQKIDCLVIDLMDVGTRVYTFVWTMLECLRACAEQQIKVIILDRPNPLGGTVFEGPVLNSGFRSFVGGAAIPLRHGLTMGELALLFNVTEDIHADVSVVPMTGWKRSMLFTETGLPWVPPSPNMPRFETAVLYPGQVLLEGTNLSEGRGTTTPFEICGAPWLNAEQFAAEVSRQDHPGIALQPVRFRPTFDKWKNQTCEGIAIHICDAAAVQSVRLTCSVIYAAMRLAPQEFRWLDPPYEYEFHTPPIDILFGSDVLRKRVDAGSPLEWDDLTTLTQLDSVAWQDHISASLLYN